MDHYRKFVVRSLQTLLAKKLLKRIRTYGNCELSQDFRVDNELLLREALGEKTLRSYIKAVRIATRKPVHYSDWMTVDDLITTISKP